MFLASEHPDHRGDEAWRQRAACKGLDPNLFFPAGERNEEDVERTRQAKAICGCCPMRSACLEFALAGHEQWGIWGGTTAVERRAIASSRQDLGLPVGRSV